MLNISLQILSVLGIILLVLLCVIAAVMLLVLFSPVSYRISGKKDAETFWLSAKADWLFGLLRVRYAYPEPGRVTVKLLWIKLYDSGAAASAAEDDSTEERKGERSDPDNKAAGRNTVDEGKNEHSIVRTDTRAEKFPEKSGESGKEALLENIGESGSEGSSGKDGESGEGESPEEDVGIGREAPAGISKKIEKIKFTICSIYDKIKKIWQNISYYVLLLQEEETHQLFSHAITRLGKIFRHIRPRKLEADILFGTGAPDTTGYVFGVYGMLSPALGPGVVVTPDFEHAVFEGVFSSTGYITSAVVAWQLLRVALDRRLWKLWDRLKTGIGSDNGQTDVADRGNESQDDGADGNSNT